MISFSQLQTLYGTLSQNTSATNLATGAQLMNYEQRYLLQKFFSNEASFTFTTIGSQNLTITGTLAIGATSATLTSAWAYPTCTTQVTFSDGELRNVLFTNNSTAITWTNGLIGTNFVLSGGLLTGATSATLLTFWPYANQSTLSQFSDGEQKTVTYTQNSTTISWTGGLTGPVNNTIFTSIITVAIGVGGVQTYQLPPDYSKLKTGTLTIGNLRWNPTEILTRQEWDNLNVFPYYADIPSNFFIYNNQFNFWPIPSTTGNIITFNYQRRIPDLSIVDYTTPGTVSIAQGSTQLTGSSTTFIATVNNVSESRYIQFAQPTGDNLWYQIASVNSSTSITLMSPYQGTSILGSSTYTIGQMPILMEDFHDMLLWKALVHYFTSIVDNSKKVTEYQEEYDRKLEMLKDYAGSKTVYVNLGRRPIKLNPNLFPQNLGY